MRTKLVALTLWVVGQAAHAHGGGLDKNGCHNDRKHGGYHCHRAPSLPAPPASTATPASPVGATAQGLQQTQGRPTCYVGPKGGTYTITKSGRKNYGGC